MEQARVNIVNQDVSTVRNCIVRYIDAIYLTMYSQRNSVRSDSVTHITSAINWAAGKNDVLLRNIKLNPLEEGIIKKLRHILSLVRSEGSVLRFTSTRDIDEIDSLISRDMPNTDMTMKYIKLVLAMCGQIDYNDMAIVIPEFIIRPARAGEAHNEFYRHIIQTKHSIDLQFETVSRSVNHMWYNFWRGLTIPGTGERKQEVELLCESLYIHLLPDVKSGMGLDTLTFDAVMSSGVIARYARLVGARIVDQTTIVNLLRQNNRGILDSTTTNEGRSISNNIIYTGSYEAEAEDVPVDDNAAGDTGDDPPVDDPAVDEGGDEPPAGNDPNNPDAANDGGGDTPDNAGDGENNTTKPKDLLGLNFELPKDETLDDILYKIAVLRKIDNVLENNRDELPLSTVTALSDWKSMFIFLVDVNETKKFLSKFKITL